MHSLKRPYLTKLRFDNQQLSILKKLGEYRGKQALFKQQTPEVLKSLQTLSMIESSESSNRIEGITAPHHRVEAIILNSTEPKNRSEQEIAGYRDALHLIHESAKHMPFSTNVILQLHSIMYRYMPAKGGHWKHADNEIIEKDTIGQIKKVRFSPTSAVLTPHAMQELTDSYAAAVESHHFEPLLLIPLSIFDFLCIHPFTDGNGRTSRLLTLQLLYHFDYEVGRFISLERIFEESKETYYEVLHASSINWHEGKHDITPWLNYFWGILLRAYQEFEERVGTIKKGRGSKTDQVLQAIAKKIGAFTITDIEKMCPGVSRELIRKIMRQLRDDRKVESIGIGRGAKWKNINKN